MADSGVDTSNESSDNPIFDFSHCIIQLPRAIPINPAGQLNIPEFVTEPHDHVGKIKCSTKARHCRLKYRYGGSICSSRNHKLRFAASTNNVELVAKLLCSGADPDSSDEHKRSPLHLAACRGNIEVVRLLLSYGANPNIKDSLGNTPLHLAACTNNIRVVIELLDAGTDVSSYDKNGRNPIQLAHSKLKLIQMHRSAARNGEETAQLITEISLVVKMMCKYLQIQKTDARELEFLRLRLEKVSTRAQVDSEVQNLLDSLDSLKLR